MPDGDDTATAPARRRKPAESPRHAPEAFAAFWSAYDRKVARRDAAKAWDALQPDQALQDRIVQAARDYRRRTPDAKFRAHPATWLRGERWTDEDTGHRSASNRADGHSFDGEDPVQDLGEMLRQHRGANVEASDAV